MLGFPGVVRSCQEVWQKVSGCARMCQELPGGTDGLKDELMNELPKLSIYQLKLSFYRVIIYIGTVDAGYLGTTHKIMSISVKDKTK